MRLLGTLAITMEDGIAFDVGSRKAQALFAYLAVTQRPVPRATLTLLFWPEMDEGAAKNNLRSTLTMLKQQLAPYLAITTTTVTFQRHLPYSLDVEEFSRCIDTAVATQDSAALQAAAELYQGEFLQGFHLRNAEPFDEWLLQQRERHHVLLVRALETLVTLSLERGEYAIGLQAGHRLLAVEPWLESAHRHVMQLLALSGERAKALRQYERCCQVLATELGVEPSAETRKLYAQIQMGNLLSPPTRQDPLSAFPPLQQETTVEEDAATCTIPHNLPTPLTAFIGRQNELAFITAQVSSTDCRLLTIVGPGGMGKSSLALAAARQLWKTAPHKFADGIFWVSLAEVNVSVTQNGDPAAADEAAIGEAIMRAIAEKLSAHAGVTISSIRQLQTYLRTRSLLLVLDNVEHLVAGSNALIALLTTAPTVKVIATSRVRLNVRGERVLPLGQLSLPAVRNHATRLADLPDIRHLIKGAIWQESEAVAMFVQRAHQNNPMFAMDAETIDPVIRICYLVDGLPLGIELAATMLPLLRLDELAAELTRDLGVLETDMRDVPVDQRTLAAVFERSWRLLSVDNQQLLARLAIFPGSFRYDAAEAVAGASILAIKCLLDQSLVSKVGEDRLILHRTIQAFALRKLQERAEQIDALHVHYARYYLTLLADQEPRLCGAMCTTAIERIQADLDNIHTAWQRGVANHLYPEISHCLTGLYLFYDQYGFYGDALTLYEQTLSHVEQDGQGEWRQMVALIYGYVGFFYARLGHLAQAERAFAAGCALVDKTGHPGVATVCFGFKGAVNRGRDLPQAITLLEEGLRLARAADIGWLQELGELVLGETSLLSGNYDAAEAYTTAGYAMAKRTGWPRSLIVSHKSFGRIHIAYGHYQQAETHLREAVALAQHHHVNQLYFDSLATLGEVLRLQERFVEAQTCFTQCRKLAEKLGTETITALVLWEEGCLAEHCREYEKAKDLMRESLAIGLPYWWAHALPTLGWVYIALGEWAEAHTYFQTVVTTAEAQHRLPVSLDAQAGLAYLTAQRAPAEPRHEMGSAKSIHQATAILQQISQHPAATQQTRDRIARLAWALPETARD